MALSWDVLYDKLCIMLIPAWFRTIETRKKIVLKPLMAPAANKQQQQATVDTVDKVGFHLEMQFKAKSRAQRKLAIKVNV